MAADTKPSAEMTQPPPVDVDDGCSGKETTTAVVVQREKPELLRGLSDEEIKALEKKLLRKVDLRLLPTLGLIYIMNYLDR